jgi:hypothetical protein
VPIPLKVLPVLIDEAFLFRSSYESSLIFAAFALTAVPAIDNPAPARAPTVLVIAAPLEFPQPQPVLSFLPSALLPFTRKKLVLFYRYAYPYPVAARYASAIF